jgi:2-oxoglutarate ferredoxin oxidoreductase subunit alpha
MVPAPEIIDTKNKIGMIYYGTSMDSAQEAVDYMGKSGRHVDQMRILGFPFNKQVKSFIESHELVFVVEQNRDGQLKSLLVNELEVAPTHLQSILNIDGMPITAQFIMQQMQFKMSQVDLKEYVK